MVFYAVAIGHKPGIYETLDECNKQTDEYFGPVYRKFDTLEECEKFIEENSKLKNQPSFRGKLFTEDDIGSERDVLEISDGTIVAYIHGENNSSKLSSSGIGVFWANNHKDNVSKTLDGPQIYNRADIQASIAAIRKAKDNNYKQIVVRTNSDYLINSATKWIDGWTEKNWSKLDGTPVKNKTDFEELIEVINDMERVTWEKVDKGIFGYENAVVLARSKVKMQKEAENSTNLAANLSESKSEILKTCSDLIEGDSGAIETLKKQDAIYAVAIGRKRGIYETREQCDEQLDGFFGPVYGKFDTDEEAQKFMGKNSKLEGLPSYQGEPFKKRGKSLYFEVTSDGSIVAYIHGVYRGNSAGFGLFWADNHPDNLPRLLLEEEKDWNQPNRAEIQASIEAILYANQKGYSRIVIRTSSDYLIDLATRARQVENRWTRSDGTQIVNHQDFQELIDAITGMDRVTWEKVHRGIEGYYKAIILVKDLI